MEAHTHYLSHAVRKVLTGQGGTERGGQPVCLQMWSRHRVLTFLKSYNLARSWDTRLIHKNSFAFSCNNSKQLEYEMFKNTIYSSI